jgi:hypothetical protein
MRPLLPQLLHELARTFPSTPVVGVLSTLRDAIEQYGRQQDDELHDTLLFVMSELVNFFCAWLSSTKEPEVRPMATDGDGSQRMATDGDGSQRIATDGDGLRRIATDCNGLRRMATVCD